MKLTNEIVEGYINGQMEIQNQSEGYLYRGQIERITIEDDELIVRFTWIAKGEGYPPLPERWVNEDNRDYRAGLCIFSVSNIGPSGGEIGGSDRLCLTSPVIGETVVLYPPDGSRLDPASIKGLQFAPA